MKTVLKFSIEVLTISTKKVSQNDIKEISWTFVTEKNDINFGFETLLRLIESPS